MKLNILPDPVACANMPGGVNSVVFDHAAGFLAGGHEITSRDADLNIVHAIAQAPQIDIFHCHGLYPIGPNHFDQSFSRANNILLNNALKAKLTICISEFSANILRHKLHIDPVVTRNGIWAMDYKRGGSERGPILFPKAALDANAKPDDMVWLRNNTEFDLLSIAKIQNIKSVGKLDRKSFLEVLASCSVYLGTTKENNSMATMEALIMGVPVVGYDFGFNAEWLISGNGCELVPYGDRHALKDALLKVKGNWKHYSKDASRFAEMFDWKPVIKELLSLYEKVLRAPEKETVSIIIPCHNYERWIADAIKSALNQTIPCEVIVVDDCSTDKSIGIAAKFPVKIIRNKINLGVAETRNIGIRIAKGEFIICLDADDILHPDFAEKHLAAFESNEDAITFAPVALVDENGDQKNQSFFRADARPELHAVGKNQVPSCCMFRRSWWLRAGGYDKIYTPAEDAHLWLKIFQLGGRARKAFNQPLMDYRIHGNSLSAKGFPEWWKGFEINFSSPIQERDPIVTVVIDKENEGTKETLWSLENQTYPNWSCLLPSQHNMKETFPWLNRTTHRKGSVINITSGTKLPPNFLAEYLMQTPEWIRLAPGKNPLMSQ